MFINWIDTLATVRHKLWCSLSSVGDRVRVIEYETFFSGSLDDRVNRLLLLLDFLGVKRPGQFPQSDRAEFYRKAAYFLHSKRQKMTTAKLARTFITNYDKLRLAYSHWTMASFNKLTIV